MKHSVKISFMAIVAMFAFSVVAKAQDLVTFDGEKFSVQHPKEYADVIDDWTPGVVNEWKKDDQHKLSVWPDEFSDTTVETLKDWGGIMKQDLAEKNEGWTIEEPVVSGNYLTIRMTAGDAVQYYYATVVDGKNFFDGKMSFLAAEEAQYKPVLEAVIASIKKK